MSAVMEDEVMQDGYMETMSAATTVQRNNGNVDGNVARMEKRGQVSPVKTRSASTKAVRMVKVTVELPEDDVRLIEFSLQVEGGTLEGFVANATLRDTGVLKEKFKSVIRRSHSRRNKADKDSAHGNDNQHAEYRED